MKLIPFILLLLASIIIASRFSSSLQDKLTPCTTDSDCHLKNPDICPEDMPYCIADIKEILK